MPELPEVQTIVNDLNKKIIGQKIVGVWFDAPKIIKKPKLSEFEKQIKGLKIVDVKRRGKNILIYLIKSRGAHKKAQEFLLLIHQKMTGHLLYGKWKIEKGTAESLLKGPLEEKVNNYIHLIFYFDSGWQMALSDLRKFAKILFGSKKEIENSPDLAKLGPEPLNKSFNLSIFQSLISKEKRKIKQVLMDQKVLVGIGNIYSDEILWEAKIHPFRSANKLIFSELKKIWLAMGKILKKAVKLKGTSTSDFRDTGGRPGGYTGKRLVYQREGELCRRCQTPIKRVKMGGRSAHYCPKCQAFRAN